MSSESTLPVWRSPKLRQLEVSGGDADEGRLAEPDVSILTGLSAEAVEAALWLRPIVVVSGKHGKYEVLAGLMSYRVARAFYDPRDAVPVVEVVKQKGRDELLDGIEHLVLPAAEGAGAQEHVIRRWVSYLEYAPKVMSRLGFKGLTRAGLASLLGITRNRLYRSLKADAVDHR